MRVFVAAAPVFQPLIADATAFFRETERTGSPLFVPGRSAGTIPPREAPGRQWRACAASGEPPPAVIAICLATRTDVFLFTAESSAFSVAVDLLLRVVDPARGRRHRADEIMDGAIEASSTLKKPSK